MKFGIVGTGVVGTTLAVSLEKVGYSCVGVHTRSSTSYQTFSRYLNVPHLSLRELVPKADLLFITTQDGMIRSVAELLATQRPIPKGQVWIHCSGALCSDVLRIEEIPVSCLSIHPLQSFANVEAALGLLENTHFTVEGDKSELGTELVKDLGGIPHVIATANKALYHAGAVIASNYLVVLASVATKLLEVSGINGGQALDALLPLMEGALRNVGQLGLPQALTGPLARADLEVFYKHLEKMPPSMAPVYLALAPEAVNLAIEKWAKNGKVYPVAVSEEINRLLAIKIKEVF